ncbi:MAG: DNA polymerase III subunit epsilon [Rhodospirillales bacterium]|nr:DNA polymerase III subunit epsilon [Alphaproteobacteria bacterium]MBL6928764.1 DNA polymerase III subunit epsilon [Rhodospirillales bacterium]
MREIVLDTETTGLDPASGDRIVEIGAVELINHLPTEEVHHIYINPQRDMPEGAFAVHGLSKEFLADKPVFADVADAFVDFVGDADLVIHNAEFDMKFLDFEFGLMGKTALSENRVIDTLVMARRKFPGSPANLDALCRRFQIDLSDRSLHGALKDARLLGEVYLELIGGRQTDLALAREAAQAPTAAQAATGNQRAARPHAPSAEEEARHAAFLEKLKNPLWSA